MHVSHVAEPCAPEAASSGMGRWALRAQFGGWYLRPAPVPMAAEDYPGSRRDVLNTERDGGFTCKICFSTVTVIQEWNGSVDPEEVTRVILHVGDITNWYNELNHNDCLNGVAWLLKQMPQWHGQSTPHAHGPNGRPQQTFDRCSVDILWIQQ